MVEQRFNLLTVESYNKVIGRCRELIAMSKFDDIKKEFGYPTNGIYETSGDFLNPSDDDGTLDILYFYNDYTNKDAYLYLIGDVEGKDGATLFYLVRNDSCDVYPVGTYKSAEELVEQINKEYNAMKYFDSLFSKVEELKEKKDEELEDLCFVYSADISADYLFENLDSFFESYSNPNSRLHSVYTAKKITEDLEKLINSK